MNLQCDSSLGARYTSRSQQSRVISEDWCLNNLYCPACPSPRLGETPVNTRSVDFRCNACNAGYQLKSFQRSLGTKIVDSAYSAMIHAIETGTVPHLFALHYNLTWQINTVLLIPSFYFTASAIQKRNALGPNTRRAGWVGCNILLGHIPASGRITLVQDGRAVPKARVRKAFDSLHVLNEIKPGREARGWTLDVLRIVESLGQRHFSLADMYRFEAELQGLHPGNNNVRAKIRQQLQILRDLGRIHFQAAGQYELI
jgi:type II restriction enzyme